MEENALSLEGKQLEERSAVLQEREAGASFRLQPPGFLE